MSYRLQACRYNDQLLSSIGIIQQYLRMGFASLDDEADYASLYNVNPLDYWDDKDPDISDEDPNV